MTSHGSAYARFRRALDTGNLTMIRAAAAELPQVSLSDALQVCWAIRHGEAELYERACVRWLARFCAEAEAVTLPDVRAAAGALGDLGERQRERPAVGALNALCSRYGLRTL